MRFPDRRRPCLVNLRTSTSDKCQPGMSGVARRHGVPEPAPPAFIEKGEHAREVGFVLVAWVLRFVEQDNLRRKARKPFFSGKADARDRQAYRGVPAVAPVGAVAFFEKGLEFVFTVCTVQ